LRSQLGTAEARYVSYNFIIFTIPIFEFLTITYPVISAELGYSPVFEIKNKYKLQNKTYDLPESHSIISKQASRYNCFGARCYVDQTDNHRPVSETVVA